MIAMCYLRVAKRGHRYHFKVTGRPTHEPITDTHGNAYPTILLKVKLDLPDSAFDGVTAELEARVPEGAIESAIELKVVE